MNNFDKTLMMPPGPWGWWLLGSIPDVIKEGIADLNLTYAAKYGPVFKISYAKYAVVAVADPELARYSFVLQVLQV